jgi:hypothetical protein
LALIINDLLVLDHVGKIADVLANVIALRYGCAINCAAKLGLAQWHGSERREQVDRRASWG